MTRSSSPLSRAVEYLGLGRPAPEAGYGTNERAGAMPVCEICGALVAIESQRLHTDWHRRLDGSRPTR